MTLAHNSRRGSAMVEFTLVGIPLVFFLISTFEMARAMWTYHTLAYTVKEGARFAIVKGAGCAAPNSCSATVGDLMRRLQRTGIGLDPSTLKVYLTSAAGTLPCEPMRACLSNATVWPPDGSNEVGLDIGIRAEYPFRSALAMFWPGHTAVTFGTFNLPAAAMETIQF